jgi:hypothetical protein
LDGNSETKKDGEALELVEEEEPVQMDKRKQTDKIQEGYEAGDVVDNSDDHEDGYDVDYRG